MEERTSADWWKTFEVNLLGVFNTARPAMKYLKKADGYFVAVTSIGGQFRSPNGSDYQVRDHKCRDARPCVDPCYTGIEACAEQAHRTHRSRKSAR